MAREIGFWKKVGDAIQSVFPSGANLLINGVDKYINFNEDVGSTGYGFRDNAGVIQFKNSGGSWSAFGGGSGGGDMLSTNNLSDVANVATARTNLGLGTAAQQPTTAFAAALGADDNYVTDAEKAALHTHSNKAVLDATTASFTTADETKLDGIAAGAEVNVNADWNAVSGDALILNKPSIPTQYTDELAQDAVGTILTDSTEIDFTYNDATPSITAAIVAGSIDETKLDTSVNASLDKADSASQPGHTHTLANVTDVTASAAELNILDGATLSTTELNYVDGVTSAIQTQLNAKVGFTKTTITSSATPTPTGNAMRNELIVTALAENATIAAPTGTPAAGNMLKLIITATGATRTVGYNAALTAGNVTRTTSVPAGETLVQVYQYENSVWVAHYDNIN